MAKRCPKCGNFLMDDETFCSQCGENVGNTVNVPPAEKSAADSAEPAVIAAAPNPAADSAGYMREELPQSGGYTTPQYQQYQQQQQQYQQQQQQYQQQQQQQYQQAPQYSAPAGQYGYQEPQPPALTIGQWVGTILLTSCLGPISFIILIVMAISSKHPAKRGFCRAKLIVDIVLFLIGALISLIFVGIIDSIITNFTEAITDILKDIGIDISAMG